MKRAADNDNSFQRESNAKQTRLIQQRIRNAARRLAECRANPELSIDVGETVIDLLITKYPDCPRWVSRTVDQLTVQNEFLSETR